MEMEQVVHSPEAQRQLYKRSLLVVIMSQIFGGAGLAAGVTVGALIARKCLAAKAMRVYLQLCLH